MIKEHEGIRYYHCSNVPKGDVFLAFKHGFSDYLINTSMEEEAFFTRMFGVEGNSLEHSFIAYKEELPVGLLLGGKRLFDGVETMRCGTMCVIPGNRGKGIAHTLLALHKEEAKKLGCTQLFLEVITSNTPAFSLYQLQEYDIVYELSYYHHIQFPVSNSTQEIKESTVEEFSTHFGKIGHLPWQSSLDSLENRTDIHYYTVEGGGLAISTLGEIMQLWVEPEKRGNDLGAELVSYALDSLGGKREVWINFPNNSSLWYWVNNLGFYKRDISQYEMYQYLP